MYTNYHSDMNKKYEMKTRKPEHSFCVIFQGYVCEDCDLDLDLDLDEGQYVCTKCASRRIERKEALQEIVSTEISYGKDLNIIKEVGQTSNKSQHR